MSETARSICGACWRELTLFDGGESCGHCTPGRRTFAEREAAAANICCWLFWYLPVGWAIFSIGLMRYCPLAWHDLCGAFAWLQPLLDYLNNNATG